ncbi:MAG: O-acetyl-ADP-ribose deacetylase [Clostridia bacterium]|nr:O-acetyl-ADP-ribose deacetylase [Clostridia bacterium]
MPFLIVRNDITLMAVDAIVNAANPSLLGGGGVDGAIHLAAGPELLAECRTLGGCDTGDAKATKGYRLPCRYVIHTVGPIWEGGNDGEAELLRSCYRRSLELAVELGCESVAFPLISAGAYGYPHKEALRIASDTVTAFLQSHELTVYLVIFDRRSFAIGRALFDDIRSFLDERYADTHTPRESRPIEFAATARCLEAASAPSPLSLDHVLSQIDESFSEAVLRLIDQKGLTDTACYKKANLDRKLFSKLRSDAQYRPSKNTAIALAVALELSLDDTEDLLRKAGFALSHSREFDVIIEYCIRHRMYNIHTINEALFAFDQPLLGS